MSGFFTIHGKAKIKDTRAARKIIKKLEDEAGELEIDVLVSVDKGYIWLEIGGGQDISYSGAEDFCNELRKLSPLVKQGEAGLFETHLDDEREDVWVGSEADIAVGQLEEKLLKARAAIDELPADEKEKLILSYIEAKSWSK